MIDVNCYLGHFAFRQLRNNTADGLLRLMDKKGIEKAVVSSAASIAYRNPHAGNEEIAAEIKGHEDRLIPFGVLSPVYADWEHDLKVCREEFGMKGLRLYPNWHKYRLNEGASVEMANAAAEKGMLISIQRRVEDRRQGSWLVDIPYVGIDEIIGLIKAAPKAQFILMSGSGYAGSPLGKKNNGLPANYFIEICLLSVEFQNELGRLVQDLGEDRIVFGTGAPFHCIDPSLVKLEMLEASDSVKQKIRHGNAARLLGLS